MKIIGLVDTTQYAHKRMKDRDLKYVADSSLNWGKQDFSQYNSIQKPLKEGVKTQISFKGFGFGLAKKMLKPVVKPIPRKLTQKVFNSLERISDTQYEYYRNVRKNYVDFIKLPDTETNDAKELLKRKAAAEFRKKNGITDEIAKNISEENLYYLPQKTVLMRFFAQVIAPFKALYNGIKKMVLPKNSQTAEILEMQEKILKDFNGLQGLINSHEIWENGYRKMSGNPKWMANNDFLIPDAVLDGKIQRRRNKFVDPNKGKYSSTSMMLGNRFISGVIYSYFLGTDAYNTTMRYSNNKQEASAQRTSRVAQEFSRIGMNMYIQNLLFGTFEAAVNRSLSTAMLVSGSTVACSEILGRKLVGKPILPSDKQTLDRMEQEMNEKSGILPAIGRLLTNTKKKTPPVSLKNSNENTVNSVMYEKAAPNRQTFASFSAKEKQSHSSQSFKAAFVPSFKGYYKVDNLVDKEKLSRLIKIIESADYKTAKKIKETLQKSILASEMFKNKEYSIKTYEELLSSQELTQIPVGTNKTFVGRLTTSILIPVKFVKNLSISLAKGVKKLFYSMTGKKIDKYAQELEMLKNSSLEKDKLKYQSFQKMLSERLETPAWKFSKFLSEEKEYRIFKEFLDTAKKSNEDIEGTKNILLWLDKQLKKENIKIREDGTLDPKDIEKVKNILMDSVLRADSAKHVEYDGNTLAQTNINLSRAITTLFLMTDAYNLTMQYSNDNRKEANKSAKNRAAQEISRIGVSAYILAFVHNLLSKLCNSSLAGAFTLTAITSSINDSISRKVVGVPLSAKSQEELFEIDRENAKSKSPIKKALAYSIGKKSALPQQAGDSSNSADIDYFSNDFFIMPEIN